MMLQLYVWAPDRQCFIDGMVANGFATLDKDGNPIWHPCAQVDEIVPVVKLGASTDPLKPVVISEVGGWHVNLRGFGELETQLTYGLPQTNADGSLKSCFERTRILGMCQTVSGEPFTWDALPSDGVPAGYKGPHGVVIYDPAAVAAPYRVWA
jgi:hypothetical protein